MEGRDKYDKIKKINKYFETDKLRSRKISKDIPDWKNIIQKLIENEIKRLEEADCARPNSLDHEKYLKLVRMREKLENDKKHSKLSRLLKKETSFLNER